MKFFIIYFTLSILFEILFANVVNGHYRPLVRAKRMSNGCNTSGGYSSGGYGGYAIVRDTYPQQKKDIDPLLLLVGAGAIIGKVNSLLSLLSLNQLMIS